MDEFRQQFENVGRNEFHVFLQPVQLSVVFRHFHRGFRNIHSSNRKGAAPGRVQRERAGMGKAVQDPLSPGQPGHLQPVVLLIQEETGLLAVFHIHVIKYAILTDTGQRGSGRGTIPAFIFRQTFQLPDGNVVPLIQSPDGDAVFFQFFQKQVIDQVFIFLCSVRQNL